MKRQVCVGPVGPVGIPFMPINKLHEFIHLRVCVWPGQY